MGYTIEKTHHEKIHDMRGKFSHPISIRYHGTAVPSLIDVDIDKGRGLLIYPLQKTIHPFVHSIHEAINSTDKSRSLRDTLSHYYSCVQPSSAADWIGLPSTSNSPLQEFAPWALTMPWSSRTPDQLKSIRENTALEENKALGHRLSIEDGWHFWGPLSTIKLDIEIQRFTKLLGSMQANGFRRHNGHDGDIRAVILQKQDDWRWQVVGGEHRAAAICAFGYKTAPVRVLQVINRDDVDFWPGVCNGLFTRDEALRTFDIIFHGELSMVSRKWSLSDS
jgi:hypothetical protein